MGTGGSVNQKNKTFNEKKEKDKKKERDYIPELEIKGKKRLIDFNEINRIKKTIRYNM